MIDEEFDPTVEQLGILGRLFIQAQSYPCLPFLQESYLYETQFGEVPENRPFEIAELFNVGLIDFLGRQAHPQPGMPALRNEDGKLRDSIALTPAGVFYCASRPHKFAEAEFGVVRDQPSEHADGIWAIYGHFSPSESPNAPTADGPVSFDHNSSAYLNAVQRLDAVSEALASDNEIGAEYTDERDQRLEELVKIRELLEKGSSSRTRLIWVAWGTLAYLSTQFADRPIGQLADLAWGAVKHLLGLA